MRSIKELTDFGKGKKAIIIGNGRSILNVEFDKINLSSYIVFGINHYHQPVKPNYVIYYDSHVYGKKPNEYYKDLPDDIKLIGFDLSKCDRCNYYFTSRNYPGAPSDVIYQDSGGHMLQIASNIMHFDSIYLFGYDYHDQSGYLRYTDKQKATKDEMEKYTKSVFTRALHKYTYPNCIHAKLDECDCRPEDIYQCKNIFNCSENSALTRFQYIDYRRI